MSKYCTIFAGADIQCYEDINIQNGSYIICADRGYNHCLRLGIKPDCLIGDFDSINSKLPDDIDIITYPSEKDDTDTMLAVKLALEKGYTDISIYGAVGGRLDHTFANIQVLIYIYKHGGYGKIYGDGNIAFLHGEYQKDYLRYGGYYFSVFSLSEKCEGLTLSGTKYPLKNSEISNSFPIGISNQIIDTHVHVELKSGLLLLIFSKDMNQKF